MSDSDKKAAILQHIKHIRIALKGDDFSKIVNEFLGFGIYLNNHYPECDDIGDLQKRVRQTISDTGDNKIENIMNSLPGADYEVDNLQNFINVLSKCHKNYHWLYHDGYVARIPGKISDFYNKVNYAALMFRNFEATIKPELNDENVVVKDSGSYKNLVSEITVAI